MGRLIASTITISLLVFACLALIPQEVRASNTLDVPEDYPTIQAAIDAASAGDTVLVAPGTYYEHITMKPGVTIQGSGADVTTIDGTEWDVVQGANDSTITGFTITGSTIGIYCVYSSPTITNNIITGNVAGIGCYYSSPTITNNVITSNRDYGIICSDSSPTITNNIITGNGWHGIHCFWYSSPTITNNTITGNENGIGCYYSSPTITNNIITGNLYGIACSSSSPTISYNDVWGNGTNYVDCSAGPGDISADPLFVDPAAGDHHLREGSPCIDAGTNDAPGLPEIDFDGNSRIVDGDWDGAAIVDMGAFEYIAIDPTPPTGSITINDGAPYATSRSVTLTLSASDPESGVSEMCFSNDGTTYTDWETYATSRDWTLTSGDGTKWVYVKYKNGIGLWNSYSDTIILDTTLPSAFDLSSPANNSWVNTKRPKLSWEASSDSGSGLKEYYVYVDNTHRATVTGTSWTPNYDLSDGSHTWYVVAVDYAGNTRQSTSTFTLKIERVPPPAPVVSSPTHPDNSVWYANPNPSFSWIEPYDISGISGYSYVLDQIEDTTPDDVSEGTERTKSYTNKADGEWYFHVKAVDGAGNWSAVAHRRVRIDTASVQSYYAGFFLTGISITNTYEFAPPDPNVGITHVVFRLGGVEVIDSDPAGGWTASFGMGDFGPSPELRVEAYDGSTLVFGPYVSDLPVIETPPWLQNLLSTSDVTLGEKMESGRVYWTMHVDAELLDWLAAYNSDLAGFLQSGTDLYYVEMDYVGGFWGLMSQPVDFSFEISSDMSDIWINLSAEAGMDLTVAGYGANVEVGFSTRFRFDLDDGDVDWGGLTVSIGGSAKVEYWVPVVFYVIPGALGTTIEPHAELELTLPDVSVGGDIGCRVEGWAFATVGIVSGKLTVGGDATLAAHEPDFSPYLTIYIYVKGEAWGLFWKVWEDEWGWTWTSNPSSQENTSDNSSENSDGWELIDRTYATADYSQFVWEEGNVKGTLVQNVYPFASPSIAVDRDGNMITAWTHDNVDENLQKALEIYYSYYDSDTRTWYEPAALTANDLLDFNPLVTFLDDNRAIAVWHRIPYEVSASTPPLEALSNIELVYSVWDPNAGTWGEPENITSGGSLNTMPSIGRVGNQLMLTYVLDEDNDPFTFEGNSLYYAWWDGEAWVEPELLEQGVTLLSTPSVAMLDENNGALAFARDMDENILTENDREIYYLRYLNGGWGEPQRLTLDNKEDASPSLTWLDGKSHLSWIKRNVAKDNSFVDVIYIGEVSDGTISALSTVVENSIINHQQLLSDGSNLCLIYQTCQKNTPYMLRYSEGIWEEVSELAGDGYYYQLSACIGDDHMGIVTIEAQMELVNNVPTQTRSDIYVSMPDFMPPPKPTLISPPDGTITNDNTPTFEWSSVSDLSGVTYRLQVDNDPDFSSPEVDVSSLTIGGKLHTYTFLDTVNNKAWEYGDSSLLTPSSVPNTAIAATSSDYVRMEVFDYWQWATSYPGGNDHQYYMFKIEESINSIDNIVIRWDGYAYTWTYGEGPVGTFLYIWNRNTGSWERQDDAIDYYFEEHTVMEYTITGNVSDYVDSTSKELWIAVDTAVWATCPILYVWTADGHYEYVADISTAGGLGFAGKLGDVFQPPQPLDYTIIDDLRVENGVYKLVVGEDQDEITYFDSAKLKEVYHPLAAKLYSATPIWTTRPFPETTFHTAINPRPPAAAWDENGADILPLIKTDDGRWTPMGTPHRYDQIILDLGDLSGAEQIKLLIKARTFWVNEPPNDRVSYVEVPDENGNWVRVDWREESWPEFTYHNTRVFALDITDWFKTDNYWLRLNDWHQKTYDYIAVDTSVDNWFYVNELDLNSAELFNKGISPGIDGIFYYDEAHGGISRKYEGYFTRYGDVTELVEKTDDKFVIMPPGDAIELEFNENLLDSFGSVERSYVFVSDAYYKMDFVKFLFHENVCRVEPLPFHAMSYYPYPENENYPSDEEHLAYIEKYNTRHIAPPTLNEENHHSLFTDYVEVKVAYTAETGLTTSEYELTPAEALRGDVYYWRVRAVDGAGNVGDWSTTWSFIVVGPPKVVAHGNDTAVNVDLDDVPPWAWYAENSFPPIMAERRIGAGAVVASGTAPTCRNGRWTPGEWDVMVDEVFQWMVPGAENILWYEGYGVYNTTWRCSNLVNALGTIGYTVTGDSTEPITAVLLEPYDVLVIPQLELGQPGTGGDPNLLPDVDVEAIVSFVEAGGGLLIMEGSDSHGHNYYMVQNKILEALGMGVYFQSDQVQDSEANPVYKFDAVVDTGTEIGAAYQAATGLTTVEVYSVCSLTYEAPPLTLMIAPSDDAAVYESDPDTPEIRTDRIGIRTWDNSHDNVTDYRNVRSFVKFDLSGIPEGATIIDARLVLYKYYAGYTISGVTDVEVIAAGDDWVENTVTWNTQPQPSGYVIDSWEVPPLGVWASWTVTDFVADEFGGDATASLRLRASEESYDDQWRNVYFRSKDYFDPYYHPYLEVTYVPA